MNSIKIEKDFYFNSTKVLSRLKRRIISSQEIIDEKLIDYTNIRNKFNNSHEDYEILENLKKELDLENQQMDFLIAKQKLENFITKNTNDTSKIASKSFDYAIKLITEKIPKINLDYSFANELIAEMFDDCKRKLESAIENGHIRPTAFYYIMKIYDDRGENLSAFEYGRDSLDIEHEYVELSKIHIKICHAVKDLYSDYREEALEHIEAEKERLRKILKTDVDEWGNPLNAKS